MICSKMFQLTWLTIELPRDFSIPLYSACPGSSNFVELVRLHCIILLQKISLYYDKLHYLGLWIHELYLSRPFLYCMIRWKFLCWLQMFTICWVNTGGAKVYTLLTFYWHAWHRSKKLPVWRVGEWSCASRDIIQPRLPITVGFSAVWAAAHSFALRCHKQQWINCTVIYSQYTEYDLISHRKLV